VPSFLNCSSCLLLNFLKALVVILTFDITLHLYECACKISKEIEREVADPFHRTFTLFNF
jgi:hypothetical protein